MGDNVTLDLGTGGALVATEDDGTSHHQKVKIEFGDAGTQQLVTQFKGLPIVPAEYSADAFGRFRVSQPQTIFDSKLLWDNQPILWDDQETSGGGTTSVHSTAGASVTLSTSLNTAGTRVRQTRRHFDYQPGKSQLIMITGVFGAGVAGITRRIGLFQENDGLFFNQVGTTFGVTIRSSVSGSPVETTVLQAAWNIDKLDGTGRSGVTLDLSKGQLFLIDYEWLSIGRVRFGFVLEGYTHYVHEFLNANNLSTAYMSTPNLPLRYEITSGGASAASSLLQICTAVISEGGLIDFGSSRSHSTGTTLITTASSGTIYAIVGIRLKSTHLDATTSVREIEVLITSANNSGEWLLIHNPSIAGTFVYGDVVDSPLQKAVSIAASNSIITGGHIMDSGYVESANKGKSVDQAVLDSLTLGSLIDGTQDQIALCFRPFNNNVTLRATLIVKELG